MCISPALLSETEFNEKILNIEMLLYESITNNEKTNLDQIHVDAKKANEAAWANIKRVMTLEASIEIIIQSVNTGSAK